MEGKSKFGFVAIIGRPNVGKSSILNALIGQKISIVSSKAQTTRNRIMGILTKNNSQLVFLDTPGIHKARNGLDNYMAKAISQTISSVDVILLVVDANSNLESSESDFIKIIKNLKNYKVPRILALNKIDLIKEKEDLLKLLNYYSKLAEFSEIIPVSAIKKDGVEILFNALEKNIPDGMHYFNEDDLTDQPERVLVSEIVREKILRYLDKEIPHGVAVYTEKMKERDTDKKILDISLVIYCEKKSHKGIIIGQNGSMLKKIGSSARFDIEKLLSIPVNLKLWVKVKEDWRNNLNSLNEFGYNQKDLK